ncbi:MAG: ATP-binding protein [Cyanobacteria bacterium J06643_13]
MMNTTNLTVEQTIGDFKQDLFPSKEYLILSFSPGSIPLQQRWRNNCLSADFLADYLSTFFLNDNNSEPDTEKQVEVKSAVSYIANELLENAMKYCVKKTSLPITIKIHLTPNIIIIQLTNCATVEQTKNFQSHINNLLAGDPSEMYLAQLEKNAIAEADTASNLGLLTMLNDYDAKLGWNFTSVAEQTDTISITTMVQLAI